MLLRASLLISAILTQPAFAASGWISLRSAGFEVITDAGPSTARDTLKRFERIRHVFEARTRQQKLTPLPVRVFVFRSEQSFRPFQISGLAAGYYQGSRDEDIIAMQASGSETYRVVQHEFAHLLMRHAGYNVPVWLNEGTAELFSTLSFSDGQAKIGDLIPTHIATLRGARILDLKSLMAVTHDSPHYNERGKTGIFYAQSWALVHMLNFSPHYQKGLANFLSMILKGEGHARSFEQAFGKSLSDVSADLLSYIQRDRYTGVAVAIPKLADSVKIPHKELAPDEVGLLQAGLLLAIDRSEQAEAIYNRLLAEHPRSPGVHAALGNLNVRNNRDEVARRYFERAIELGDRTGHVRLDYAMLLRELGTPEEKLIPILQEALSLEPALFEAHHVLGYLQLKLNRLPDAIATLKAAAALRPEGAAIWEYLALAYHRSGAREEALAAAKTARKHASSPEEAARIDATVALIESGDSVVRTTPQPGPSFDSAAGKTRDSASAQSKLPSAAGILTQIDCLGRSYRLHLITDRTKLLLLVRDPSGVVIRNAGPIEFSCGPVQERRMRVEYRDAPSKTYLTHGDVVSITFE